MYNSWNNFYIRAKQTVYKWWCVIYKPAYKLFHQGYWPQEKEPYYTPDSQHTNENSSDSDDGNKRLLAEQMARQIEAGNQHNVDNIILSTEKSEQNCTEPVNENESETTDVGNNADTETPKPSEDVMAKAQEIMERLAREAAEDEAKKQAEIDAAKRKAAEQERLANIMKANERDISIYIEEGKAHQTDIHTSEQKGE